MNPALSLQNPSLSFSALRPRYAGAVVALACTGLALAYMLAQETPVGRVQGHVIIGDTGKPLAHTKIVLTPDTSGDDENELTDEVTGQRRFRAVTDRHGNFSIAKIPAGFYAATAYTHAHSIDKQYVSVGEGATSEVKLYLKRSQPELLMTQHQRIFLSSEQVSLPVHGYVDGSKPKGRDALRLRVFRTRLSQVLKNQKMASALQTVGQRWEAPPQLPQELLHPAVGTAPQLITQQDVPITEADQEGFFHKRVKFNTPGPGLYLVDITHHKKTVCAWAQVTDTALVTKKARQQLVAYLVDMKTGQPRVGKPVKVYHQGRMVAQGTTANDGVVNLRIPATQDDSKLMTVALSGEDEGVVSQYDYEREDAGDFTVHAYTDRPVYRPGQRIHYKGIARRVVEPGTRYAVQIDEPVEVELRDPSGERLLHKSQNTNHFGAFHGSVELSPEAPTGGYEMIMKIGDENHTQSIMVAAYRKPEYTVTVTPSQKRYTHGDEVEMFVAAQFYFGAPVPGAKVQYQIYRATDWASEYADSYGDGESGLPGDEAGEDEESEYQSDEYGGEYEGGSGETVTEGQATLDANGHTIIRFSSKPEDNKSSTKGSDAEGEEEESVAPPQSQMFTTHITVTDAAGREITAEGQARVTAGDFHLSVVPEGYVAEPRQPAQVKIIARDYEGKPIPNLPLQLENGYEEWSEGQEQSNFKSIGTTKAVTGPDGKVSITVKPPKTGYLKIHARATDSHKNPIAAQASLWVSSNGEDNSYTRYDDLSLLTDKKRYEAGDTARVLINSKHTGQTILVALEGSKIYRVFTVKSSQKSSLIHIPILADYGPNVYLTACYVRNKKFSQSDIPLRVAVPARKVTVKIQPDRWKHKPGDNVTYNIQTMDAKGRAIPCEFSFGVVDEAIYAIRKDNPAALRNEFYPRRYNAVNTGYSFAEQYLGDADKGAPQVVARKRFPDTAYWQPDLQTDSNGRATVSFRLPDNLTTWRATAVAQTVDTAFGRNTNKIVSAKNFFVRLEAPRFLTQGDQSRLMAFVHNETGVAQKAFVRLEAEGLSVNGSTTQTLTLQPGQVGQAMWPVSIDLMGVDLKGTSRIHVTAWTDNSTGGTQYTDGLENTLPIRPHGREEITTAAGQLTASNPAQEELTIAPSTIPGLNRLTVRLSPSVTGALAGALDYLVGFPYGCTEQTMSRFLPDILVQRILRLSRTSNKKLDKQLPKMVRDGLSRLYRLQHEDGDWGWWENDEANPWMTAYVLYGLTIAKAEGYPVSETVLARAREATARLARQSPVKNVYWGYNQEDRPFMLYALALAGDKQTPRKLLAQLKPATLGAEALAYLVLLDKELGGTGETALIALEKQLVTDDNGHGYWAGYGEAYLSNGNDMTATAIGLQAMMAVNPSDPRINSILLWLMTHRTGEHWGNTRDTSWVLMALCGYLQSVPDATNQNGELRVRLNGKVIETYQLTAANLSEKELVLHVPSAALRPGKNQLKIERVGGGSPAFYSVQLRQTVAMETLPALSSSGINIQREYLRVLPRQTGQDRWSLQTEPTNNQFKQGEHIRVRLTLNVPRDLTYILLEDAFPSGCEVTERGSAGAEGEDWNFWWSNTDVRDDRIAFFMRTLSKGKHVIEYNLRPQTPGKSRALPTLLQAMYAPSTRAESAEAQLEVRE